MPSSIRWRGDGESRKSESSSSRYSNSSDHSHSTAPTTYSLRPQPPRHDTCQARVESCYQGQSFDSFADSKASTDTYASTTPSDDDQLDEEGPIYEVPEFSEEGYQFDPIHDAIPSTPKDFSHLFPSSRRLSIRHDDSSIDGNMNLRVDTQVEPSWSSKKINYTLFHLRLQDLKTRNFSLRRYCRDSGREVCHSVRKYQTATSDRPALHKSFSSAFATFRKQADSKSTGVGSLKRSDSGYGSIDGVRDERAVPSDKTETPSRLPTNTIKLEFSNYAHVSVKRRGAGANKRYEFEYWGHRYAWRRHVKREGRFEEVSYHLMRDDKFRALAYIVPVLLTTSQTEEERLRGGWIPPCSMWITDEDVLSALPDVADLVVSTGLISLVDDSIKRRWHSTRSRQLLLPLTRSSSFRMNMEYIGPKRLIDGVFNRGG